jgi:hypothetical protein
VEKSKQCLAEYRKAIATEVQKSSVDQNTLARRVHKYMITEYHTGEFQQAEYMTAGKQSTKTGANRVLKST